MMVPKLRFPEFQDAGEWDTKELGKVAALITEKAGSNRYTLMSVTAGLGLVTQIEKFGREIAGEAYRNYYVIRKGDFAYNKSSTKQHPEGQMALLENVEQGAVPNSIFTCFRVDQRSVSPYFLKYPFATNIHGKWLRNFVAVGARANGALNVDSKDLLTLPIVFPSLEEQQKIADCLSSIDELISAQSQEVEALKTHKKGLMQQLFPTEGETIPRQRFPEFRDAGEWEEKPLKEAFSIFQGFAFSSNDSVPHGVRWLKIADVSIQQMNHNAPSYLPLEYKDKYKKFSVCKGDYVIALTRPILKGELKMAPVDAVFHGALLNQRVGKLVTDQKISFIYYLLQTSKLISDIDKSISGSEPPNLSAQQIEDLKTRIPLEKEQQKIADCLSSIDELISAHRQKLDALKTHKKGLMQQLFPAAEEVEA